jgi:hypothetical protein
MTHERRLPGLATMVAVAVTGVAALGLGWRIVARSLVVPVQVPALISGGLAGLALLGAACAFFDIQADRRDAAQRADEIDAVLDEVAAMAAILRRRRGGR